MIVAGDCLDVVSERLSGPFARVSDALSADAEEDTDAQRGHDMRTRSKMLRTKLNHASAIVSHQLENLWNKSPTQNGNKIVREHKQDLSTRYRFTSSTDAVGWLQRCASLP